jgi:hypothetical protein
MWSATPPAGPGDNKYLIMCMGLRPVIHILIYFIATLPLPIVVGFVLLVCCGEMLFLCVRSLISHMRAARSAAFYTLEFISFSTAAAIQMHFCASNQFIVTLGFSVNHAQDVYVADFFVICLYENA